ncbi:hypothetical protein EZ313_04630 [Ramlibacter henchirensis]|uniref:Uncharacterized protein n=1 Tax=Ramlibacter henchirensis TaxID=204072 RepID=A0A4Z0C339_9BURK|nr:hypothetical protein [Ramlibacter henchirensis]TFZ05943.1 hypothetical protein EZ313_04630 [Ramlibacter henchirensis]
MQSANGPAPALRRFLCFERLRHDGERFAFLCDDHGRVDLDAMTEPARNDYFFARALVGHSFCVPRVQLVPAG